MNNPLALFRNLRELYLHYLDSPFDLRYGDLVRERAALLDRDGYLWRTPLIEPIPAYPVCGCSFRAVAHDTLDGAWDSRSIDEFADFVACGAFPRDLQPYEHQRRAFEQSVACGRDVVVTTGTGSGKTECFVLPVLAALVRESTRVGNARVAPLAMGLVGRPPQVFSGAEHTLRAAGVATRPRGPGNSPAAMHALTLSAERTGGGPTHSSAQSDGQSAPPGRGSTRGDKATGSTSAVTRAERRSPATVRVRTRGAFALNYAAWMPTLAWWKATRKLAGFFPRSTAPRCGRGGTCRMLPPTCSSPTTQCSISCLCVMLRRTFSTQRAVGLLVTAAMFFTSWLTNCIRTAARRVLR